MEQLLSRILDALPEKTVKNMQNLVIRGLSYDSRHISKDFLYFALPGIHVDGHAFVEQAIDKGAVCVVHQHELPNYRNKVIYVRVPDSRIAMAPVSAAFWDNPSANLVTIGITGTEGKSTMVSLVSQLLNLSGRKAGFISTVEYKVGEEILPNPEHQTTPEATTIQEKLDAMRRNGMEYAVLESSSHGLSKLMNRLGNVNFDVGLMTNVRHEHMEFHKTWENYRNDKANLFRALAKTTKTKTIGDKRLTIPSFGVVCADDPSASFFADCAEVPVYSYSARSSEALCRAENVQVDEHGSSFVLCYGSDRLQTRINLPGAFNVENALGAFLLVQKLTGFQPELLALYMEKFAPVKGRMTRIVKGQPYEVIVDYAHTPSSFEAILPSLRAQTKGKLICVFGSGGERDTQKRPEQGRIACEYCDYVILSDEDPRGENPMALLEDIAAGCASHIRGTSLFLMPDRALGIRKALSLAAPGSTVVLLGKGHENTIIYKERVIPWDEITEAGKALEELGYKKGVQ